MGNNPAKVHKVKVSPYPFAVTITGNLIGGIPMVKGNVVKLTLRGFLAEIPGNPLAVQEKYEAQFALPVMGDNVKEPVVVIKIYDKFQGKTDQKVEVYRLVEFHFKALNLNEKTSIEKFLRQIGQLK